MIEVLSFSIVMIALVLSGIKGSGKERTEESYLFASRKTGLFALTATLVMTEFNTSTLIAFSSIGYSVGLWALVLPLVFLIGLLFYAYVAAEKWKEFNGLSVAQFFSKRYGSLIGKVASGSLLLAMVGFSAVYIKSMTVLFSVLFPTINFWLLSLALTSLVLFMTLRGGLVAIIRTDLLSFCLLSIFLPILLYSAWVEVESPSVKELIASFSFESSKELLPPSFVWAILFLTMFTYILAPWYGQKIFAAQSRKTARQSVFFAAILVFLFYGLSVAAASLLSLKDSATLVL